MKIRSQSLAWSAFMALAGLFLLLKNLAIFGMWGDAAWGGLFALAGLGFLVWFVFDSGRWWRVIPGFTLASIGAEILLTWRGVNLGDWRGALVMFGLALGFWTVLIVHRDNWWAVMPGGILTLLGALNGINGLQQGRLSQEGWLALFFLGLGLIFALLYLVRFGQEDTHWAGVPAAALLLLGVVTLSGAFAVPVVIAQWWPLLLIVAGAGLAIGIFAARRPASEPVKSIEAFDAIPPAAGASVVSSLPDVARLPEKVSPTAAIAPSPSAAPGKADEPADIYALLKQQPGDKG